MVLIPEQLIGNAVVARIDEDIQVVAAGGRLDETLCVAGLETRAVGRMMKVSTSVLPTSRASGRGDCQRVCKAPLRRDRQSDRDRRLRPLWQRNHAGQDSVQPLQVLLTSILCCQYHRGAACRNAPFISIVAQRRHKISLQGKNFCIFDIFRGLNIVSHARSKKFWRILQKICKRTFGRRVAGSFMGRRCKKRARRVSLGGAVRFMVFTFRSRPGPCGGSGGPPGRGDSWRG